MKNILVSFILIGILLVSTYLPKNIETDKRQYTTEELQVMMDEWTDCLLENEEEMTEFVSDLLKRTNLEGERLSFSEKDELFYQVNSRSNIKEYCYITDISVPGTVEQLSPDDIYIAESSHEVSFNRVVSITLTDGSVMWGEAQLMYIEGDAFYGLHESWKNHIIYSNPPKEYAWLCVFNDLP